MNWTLETLLGDVADAWSAENLPYTITFWVIVGVMIWFLSRNKQKPPSSN
jgi:hypothetical protein